MAWSSLVDGTPSSAFAISDYRLHAVIELVLTTIHRCPVNNLHERRDFILQMQHPHQKHHHYGKITLGQKKTQKYFSFVPSILDHFTRTLRGKWSLHQVLVVVYGIILLLYFSCSSFLSWLVGLLTFGWRLGG